MLLSFGKRFIEVPTDKQEKLSIISPDNSLPNEKFLGLTKLKAFADNKFSVAKIMISLFDRVENIVEKGENAGYQHFLHFPLCFLEASYTGWLKVVIVW